MKKPEQKIQIFSFFFKIFSLPILFLIKKQISVENGSVPIVVENGTGDAEGTEEVVSQEVDEPVVDNEPAVEENTEEVPQANQAPIPWHTIVSLTSNFTKNVKKYKAKKIDSHSPKIYFPASVCKELQNKIRVF